VGLVPTQGSERIGRAWCQHRAVILGGRAWCQTKALKRAGGPVAKPGSSQGVQAWYEPQAVTGEGGLCANPGQ